MHDADPVHDADSDPVHDAHSASTPAAPPPRRRAGGPEDLVEVGGMGASGTAFVPREWLERALNAHDDDRATNTQAGMRAGASAGVRDLTCDRVTGALLAGDVPDALASGRTTRGRTRAKAEDPTQTYRIPTEMARLVRLRDGSCRFSGCSTPAKQCDLDHVKAWPTGPTAPPNLMALCRRHHRIKQRPGWQVRIHPDTTVTWTDPTGYQVTTRPVDHLHLVTTRATRRAATDSTTDSTTGSTRDSSTGPSGVSGSTDWPGSTQPTTLAETLARMRNLPLTFEEDLHEWLANDPLHPLHTRPRVWAFDGTLLSGPPPKIDLDSGRGPATLPAPAVTILLDYPPPPSAPDPDIIPF